MLIPSWINVKINPITLITNTKVLNIILSCSFTKHKFRALHIIIHHTTFLWHERLLIKIVEHYLLVCDYLEVTVSFRVVNQSFKLKCNIFFPLWKQVLVCFFKFVKYYFLRWLRDYDFVVGKEDLTQGFGFKSLCVNLCDGISVCVEILTFSVEAINLSILIIVKAFQRKVGLGAVCHGVLQELSFHLA